MSMRSGLCGVLMVAVVALLAGCPQKAEMALSWDNEAKMEVSYPSCGDVSVQALTAGQHINVGSVQIWNDVNNVYVSYETTGGWTLSETHVHVGFSDTDYPGYGRANNAPVPGQFPFNSDSDPEFTGMETEYVVIVPLTALGLAQWTCDIPLHVFAHAAVSLRDGQGNEIQEETAWGGDAPGAHSNRWYFVAPFTLQCCDDDGDDCGCEGTINELVLEYFRSCEAMVHIYPMDMSLGPILARKVQPGEMITLQGDILAPEIYLFVNYQIDALIRTDCSGQVGPGMLIGDFRVVSGKSDNGLELCPVIQKYECGPCEGGVTELSFMYLGDVECIPVAVTPAGSMIPFFWGCVSPYAELTVNGPGVDGLMPPAISVWVNFQYVGDIDTSCATPVGPGGIVAGPLLVTGGKSLHGGYLCPIN